jgi:hypothetical protein
MGNNTVGVSQLFDGSDTPDRLGVLELAGEERNELSKRHNPRTEVDAMVAGLDAERFDEREARERTLRWNEWFADSERVSRAKWQPLDLSCELADCEQPNVIARTHLENQFHMVAALSGVAVREPYRHERSHTGGRAALEDATTHTASRLGNVELGEPVDGCPDELLDVSEQSLCLVHSTIGPQSFLRWPRRLLEAARGHTLRSARRTGARQKSTSSLSLAYRATRRPH